MAPIHSARLEKDKRVKSIISFASHAQAQLATAASLNTAGSLHNELEIQVTTFPNNLKYTASLRYEEIDAIGTALWNSSTQLRRNYDIEKPQKVPIVLILARVFAFLFLEWPSDPKNIATGNIVRLMRIGIKAVKNCLETAQIDLALQILRKLITYDQCLRTPPPGTTLANIELYRGLLAEFDILRAAQAWKQGKLDVAEHVYMNSFVSREHFDSKTMENLADILFEIGKDLVCKGQSKIAVKWLDRAWTVINQQALDRLSTDANELRISIIQSYIKALLESEDQAAYNKAIELANFLEQDLGDRMIVLLVRLELLSAPVVESHDNIAYSEVLQRMAKSMPMNDMNVKVFLKHVRLLNAQDPILACKTLDGLLRLRLLRSEGSQWVEKVLVTRLWLTISQLDEGDSIESLEEILSTIGEFLEQPLSPVATVAAHTLLWKRIESNYTQQHYDVAERWCRMALHSIFDKSGTVNAVRIARKLMLCALGRQDLGSAREVYESMTEAAQKEPVTIFLMYKIALRCEDVELASQCLEKVASLSSKDPSLIYACVLDAQKVGDKSQVLAALQIVLERIGYGPDSSVNLPSLLRITIRLLSTVNDTVTPANKSDAVWQQTDKLCRLYEGATTSMTKSSKVPTSNANWDINELDWFSKHSYNVVMSHTSDWHPKHSLRMITCCIFFIDQYPKDIGEQVWDDLSLRKMFCEYTAATCLVNLARGEDNIEQQLQYYLDLRTHVNSFDELLQGKLVKLVEPLTNDLTRKLEALLAYDFEAACLLKSWDTLGETLLKAEICKSMTLYLVMADCIIGCKAPSHVMVTTLKKIINEAWALGALDAKMLARYMRCLFTHSMSDNRQLAEEVLDQVHQLAEDSAESGTPFPPEEAEWICTTAFNHAIDLYCCGEDHACRTWSAKALNISRFCQDEGSLERTLQGRLVNLNFEAP